MKTLIFGLLVLGFTNLTFSQNEMAYNAEKPNTSLEVAKANSTTIESSQISKRMTTFQNVVAHYDITAKTFYTPNKPATYTVVFKEAKNSITNVYDQNGAVLQSDQKFHDIRLPYTILSSIAKEYPGWGIHKVNCEVSYSEGETQSISYDIKLKKGSSTKSVKIKA
jgi:hypothetical protein